MKILFLDIDGVIAPIDEPIKKTTIREGLILPYIWNSDACEALNKIIAETDCEIVLSSDWRKSHPLSEMRELFNYHNIPGSRLIGFTPSRKEYRFGELGYGRSLEINDWLIIHGEKNWCAVDDLNLTAIDASRFARTRSDKGLLDEKIVETIINILNGESKKG